MPIIDLYKHSESRKNLAHFAAMASLAAVDGEIHPQEKQILDRFAQKLGISKEEYKEVMKEENKYPIESPLTHEERLERLYDFFRVIVSDFDMQKAQLHMVETYAIALGFSPANAKKVVDASLSVTSQWFLMVSEANIGQGRARLASLLQRSDRGVLVVRRQREFIEALVPEVDVEDEQESP